MQKTDYYKIAFFALLAAVITGGAVYFLVMNKDGKSATGGNKLEETGENKILDKKPGKEFYNSGSNAERVDNDVADDSESRVLRYINEDYGFRISLPRSWQGYRIDKNKYFDKSIETLDFGFKEGESLFNIHIFTLSQWKAATRDGADDYMMGRKLAVSSDYVFMWEQATDAPSAETADKYKDLEKIKGSFRLGSIPLGEEVMEWRSHNSAIGINFKYPNDGTYSVKNLNEKVVISQGEHPGEKFSIRRFDHKCDLVDIPRRESDEEQEFNDEMYDSFFRMGMGDPYGYYIERDGKCYVFETLGGPENETFEAIMETVEFN